MLDSSAVAVSCLKQECLNVRVVSDICLHSLPGGAPQTQAAQLAQLHGQAAARAAQAAQMHEMAAAAKAQSATAAAGVGQALLGLAKPPLAR